MSPEERRAHLIRARELFNAGDYWAAHEALETVWRSIISDDAAPAWQGLIQAGAGLLDWEAGHRPGLAGRGWGASCKKWELAQKMHDHAKKFGAEIVTDMVESVRKGGDGVFEVRTARGRVYRAPTVILTAGGTPVKLGVPGEKEYAGKGVSYCAVCDGAFFKGEVLAVVGGGDAAVEEADYLTRYASKVYIVHRRDRLRASKIIQERAFANPKIDMVWNKRVLEIKGTERGTDHLVLEDTARGGGGGGGRATLAVGGGLVFRGFHANSGLGGGHA